MMLAFEVGALTDAFDFLSFDVRHWCVNDVQL